MYSCIQPSGKHVLFSSFCCVELMLSIQSSLSGLPCCTDLDRVCRSSCNSCCSDYFWSVRAQEIDDSVDRIVAGMEGTPMVDGKSKSLVAYHEVRLMPASAKQCLGCGLLALMRPSLRAHSYHVAVKIAVHPITLLFTR